MSDARNDNARGGLRILEARFHPHGRANEFIVIGNVLCDGSGATLEVTPDFEVHVPERASASSIVWNLTYLILMNRPRPFERLLSLENRHWSFVVAAAVPELTLS